MDAITIQTSNWPIVLVVYPEKGTVESAQAFLSEMRALLFSRGTHENFACISDLTLVDPRKSNAKIRSTLAEGLKQLTHDIHARGGPHMRADARVTESAIIRGIATAMEWVRTQKEPVRYFANKTDALAWVKKMLAAAA